MEYQYGTSLTKWDTDGDGIDDKYEIQTVGFNPLSAADGTTDFDRDGLTNYDEYRRGTNPYLADLDNFGYVRTMGTAYGNYDYADIVTTLYTDSAGNTFQGGEYRMTLDFSGSGTDIKTSGYWGNAFVTKTKADGTYGWTWVAYGYYGSYTTGVTTDAAGNIYITGYFSGSTDFDPGVGTSSSYATGWGNFLVKLDATGKYLWSYSLDGYNVRSFGVATDSQGNAYMVGGFDYRTSVDFNPGTAVDTKTLKGAKDLFVTRVNADGTYGWTYTAGGVSSTINGQRIVIDAQDRIYVGGDYSGTVDLDNNAVVDDVANSQDGFVLQLNTLGQYVWKWKVGGGSSDAVKDIQLRSGGIYVLGYSYGSVNFNAAGAGDTQGKDYTTSLFLTKLTAAGGYGATRLLPASNTDKIYLGVDAQENVYIGAPLAGSLDFDPTAAVDNRAVVGSADVSVTKYFADGTYAWTRTLGGWDFDYIAGLTVDRTRGDVYVTGTFRATVDFDPSARPKNVTSKGYDDIFLVKFLNSDPARMTDSDHDGLSNEYELANSLNPNNAADAVLDSDGDGLTNLQEAFYQTDPWKVDTNGNGISDFTDHF